MDLSFLLQFIAILLFAGCYIHSWRNEGQRAARQWFLIGYIYALLLVNLLVVSGQIAYAQGMIVFGAAPSLIVMFFPALFYIAHVITVRYTVPTYLRAVGYLMFALVPWLMLPLDLVGVGSGTWYYPSNSVYFLNGIPFYVPFAWGLAGAAFAVMMARIRKIRLRGNGQFFAMILAAPLVAGLVILLIAPVQLIVNGIAALGSGAPLYLLLALLFLLLPLVVFLNVPRVSVK